jgi:hypothetical protein
MTNPYAPTPGQPMPYGVGAELYGQSASQATTSSRTAAILMIVTALLVGAAAVIGVLAMLMIPEETMRNELAAQDPQGLAELERSGMTLQTVMRVGAACFGAFGLIVTISYLVLSPFVWKNRRGGTITGVIVVGLLLLLGLLLTLGSLGDPVSMIIMLLLTGLQAAILVFLILAIAGSGGTPGPEVMAQQQAAWQHYYAQTQQQPPQSGALPQGQAWNPSASSDPHRPQDRASDPR